MSALRAAAEDYLVMRRSLGFKLTTQGRHLMRFIEFCEARHAEHITTDLALTWATQTSRSGSDEVYHSRRLMVVRIFAWHLAAVDPATEVPPEDTLPHHLPADRALPVFLGRDHRADGRGGPAGPAAAGRDLADADRLAGGDQPVLPGSPTVVQVWSSCLRSSDADGTALAYATGVAPAPDAACHRWRGAALGSAMSSRLTARAAARSWSRSSSWRRRSMACCSRRVTCWLRASVSAGAEPGLTACLVPERLGQAFFELAHAGVQPDAALMGGEQVGLQ
jgi:hypothetical protein